MGDAGKTTSGFPTGQPIGDSSKAGLGERASPSSGVRRVPTKVGDSLGEIGSSDPESHGHEAVPAGDEVATLGALAASRDLSAALALIEATLDRDRPVEVVLLHLVAPAARWLENEWRAERRAFEEVTGALDTLAEVIGALVPPSSPASEEHAPSRPGLRRTGDPRQPPSRGRSSRRANGSKR